MLQLEETPLIQGTSPNEAPMPLKKFPALKEFFPTAGEDESVRQVITTYGKEVFVGYKREFKGGETTVYPMGAVLAEISAQSDGVTYDFDIVVRNSRGTLNPENISQAVTEAKGRLRKEDFDTFRDIDQEPFNKSSYSDPRSIRIKEWDDVHPVQNQIGPFLQTASENLPGPNGAFGVSELADVLVALRKKSSDLRKNYDKAQKATTLQELAKKID
jgi:hypothetical protein